MSAATLNKIKIKKLGRRWQIKIKHWQLVGASQYPGFACTANFRQAITIVFLFLLMMLMSIVGFSLLSETLIRTHVREVILGNIYDYSMQSRLTNSDSLIAQLRQDNLAKNDELPLFLVMNKSGDILYHNHPLKNSQRTHCQMDVACLKDILSSKNDPNLIGLSVMLRDGGVFFTAYNIRPMLERVRTIPLVAGAGLFVVLLFCLLISRHFSLLSLRSVEQIRTALHRYSTGEQQVRMPLSPYGDDFDSLSADINQNLERIERLMEQVRSTSSHIAHELRTPLTHLQNRLFNLTERTGLDDDIREELNLAVGEVHKILGLFRTVMRIGEIESGRCIHQFEQIEARRLLEEVIEYYQPLAEERGCHLLIEIKAGIQLFGDRALLFQALANLVENALKYAAQGKDITLGVKLHQGWIALSVADRGPGIPTAQHQKALQRFQRLDSDSGPQQSGYGLGLSLVKAITDLHGGRLCLESANPGLNVYLCLKRC
ncbi:HAMP domain-containing histidine kinase [Brenneria goodwinii]|uniref:histidine kinase n=1 Tax=Brenneria goodwinii TaxID=1109412 RepID=A0A0G4JQY4_9GAMM|nr:HAMP domain-containing sensor histidine kinase [Brenneria goodwinii]MCG8159093.1 HAMP domain-containing histidine kinase [Brenneria goodwinii]MCG8162943.1 HAMP domain-containing histidine kinase [Brenneria goodwinii]MCG8167425.1 HAMP domain-containing histidine kinase [Brenneria goodwinii]MCG8172084.1 HAMP domain-containing histidine kinase [Brenneria goodwinii]MCG8176912.1 HAMP domain-containing histidine kinase [Brenneria goodwinii]